MHNPVYRALVTYSNNTTGEIRIKIPSLLGVDSEVSISYIGRTATNGTWVVPTAGDQIVVTADDDNLTNIFWVQTSPFNPSTTEYAGLSSLSDVTLSSPASDEILSYNGSQWVNNSSLLSAKAPLNSPTFTGTVTLPAIPSFVARKTASTFTPATGTIVYDNAQLNVGNHYNTSTGRFTAPIAGVYVFIHIMSARTASSAGYEVAIGRNGLDATRIFTHGGSQQHSAISQHVMSLSVGDYIYASCYNPSSIVFSGSSDIFYDSGRNLVSGFMGYLLR
jgi:hypothetical protein